MGKYSSDQDNANYKFFFRTLASIAEEYPVVFNGRGSNKPHSQRYREFSQRWGFIKTLYEICDEKIEKVGEVYQIYLSDFLQYMTYLIDKQRAEDDEYKYQETMRRAKRGRN